MVGSGFVFGGVFPFFACFLRGGKDFFLVLFKISRT